jgi:hypothetical protein
MLRSENNSLRQMVKAKLPSQATSILKECTIEYSVLFKNEEAKIMKPTATSSSSSSSKREIVEHDLTLIQVCDYVALQVSSLHTLDSHYQHSTSFRTDRLIFPP